MMSRAEIIDQLGKYFSLAELVCPHTLNRWGERSWQFFDTNTLLTLLVLRTKILQVPMTINAHNATQRGLRCNICPLVKDKDANYLSAHLMGKGFDVISSQMSAAQMRAKIVKQKDMLPCPIRIESGVSWLHFDTYDPTNGEEKVFIF